MAALDLKRGTIPTAPKGMDKDTLLALLPPKFSHPAVYHETEWSEQGPSWHVAPASRTTSVLNPWLPYLSRVSRAPHCPPPHPYLPDMPL